MRVVYKIVLGLLLFNAFLTLFAPIFNTSISEGAIDYETADVSQYKITGVGDVIGIIFAPENIGAMIASGTVLGIAIIVGLTLKNPTVVIGVGLFVSVVVGLYIKMSSVIANIGSETNNIYVNGIITIIGIAIGLIVVFSVVDMFAPASARE